MRNRATKENMNLDLRRYGKNLYTKAENSSGGNSEEGDVLSEYHAFEQSMESKGLHYDGYLPISVYERMSEEDGITPNYTYGNSETAVEALLFLSEDEHEMGVAFLTEKEYKAWFDQTFWNFGYTVNMRGYINPVYPEGLILQDMLLASDSLPSFWKDYPEYPIEQVTNTIYVFVINPASLEVPATIDTFLSEWASQGYSVSLIPEDLQEGGKAVVKIVDSEYGTYYMPVSISTGRS